MKAYLACAAAVALLCGCGQTPKAGVGPSKLEAEFLSDPRCQTTYYFVAQDPRQAVPAILKMLDHLPGETNVARRCDVIQGALWEAEHCTNRLYSAIIQRGRQDPAPAVRAKTDSMVARGLKKLKAGAAGDDDADDAQ